MDEYQLVAECKRQSTNCLYTSTSLFIWLRLLRGVRVVFVVVPLVFGGIVTWRVLSAQDTGWKVAATGLMALVAGVMPAVYAALRYDDYLAEAKRLGGEFKNLQDRFAQLAMIAPGLDESDFRVRFESLMDRLESARAPSITAPEWCFRRAQAKVKSGDYSPDKPAPDPK